MILKNTKAIFASSMLMLAFALNPLAAQEKEVVIDKIPGSTDEFIALRDKMATTPEGGAAVFVTALMAFSKDQQLGMQFLTIALDKSNVGSGNVYKGYAPGNSIMYHINRFNRDHKKAKVWDYTGFAYVKGATPENNYQVSAPYTIVTSRNKYSGSEASGRVKVFVNVAGFRPRPVSLKKNGKGVWKAHECSSFFVNVPPPASASEVDDL